MIRTALLFAAGAMALATPQLAGAADRLPARLAALDAGHFTRAIRINDDRLEPYVSFTSKHAYKASYGISADADAESHLTAHLDRATGRVSYRVWHDITGRDVHRELIRVQYLTGGKLTQADLSVARHWAANCVPKETGGQCDQRIRVAFDVPEAVLREVAATAEHGSRKPWRMRFKDAHGSDLTAVLAPAEAAGMVHAIDNWRADRAG